MCWRFPLKHLGTVEYNCLQLVLHAQQARKVCVGAGGEVSMDSDYSLAKIAALLFYYPINFPNTGYKGSFAAFQESSVCILGRIWI